MYAEKLNCETETNLQRGFEKIVKFLPLKNITMTLLKYLFGENLYIYGMFISKDLIKLYLLLKNKI